LPGFEADREEEAGPGFLADRSPEAFLELPGLDFGGRDGAVRPLAGWEPLLREDGRFDEEGGRF